MDRLLIIVVLLTSRADVMGEHRNGPLLRWLGWTCAVAMLISTVIMLVTEEGTITTAFDMTVLNELDRFHLVMDSIDRLPQTGDKGIYLKQQLKDKLIEHKQYIDKNGQDLPEIRNWKWSTPK
jgi:hypothetical protein